MSRRVNGRLLSRFLLAALLAVPGTSTAQAPAPAVATAADASTAAIEANFRALAAFGPRVTGSAATEQARTFLESQLRSLGYQTQRQAFAYPRFDDLGSDVKIGSETLRGTALRDSVGGTVTAPLVRIPGVGSQGSYRGLTVAGKIAVVRQGSIPLTEKARVAREAGAVGLIIVNTENRDLRGTLGGAEPLPVLTVRASLDTLLKPGLDATLNVRVRNGDVVGENLIAFKGTTPPTVLIGAHLDSVKGAPGANDNLSGTLAVVELARRVVNTPLSAQAYFVLFDGEEDGLLGSRDFVKTHAALLPGLKGMLNLDMVGVDAAPLRATGHPALMAYARPLPGVTAVEGSEGGSDHVPFEGAGVPTLSFHRGLDANYHQPGDTVLDPALVREVTDIAQAVSEGLIRPAN